MATGFSLRRNNNLRAGVCGSLPLEAPVESRRTGLIHRSKKDPFCVVREPLSTAGDRGGLAPVRIRIEDGATARQHGPPIRERIGSQHDRSEPSGGGEFVNYPWKKHFSVEPGQAGFFAAHAGRTAGGHDNGGKMWR